MMTEISFYSLFLPLTHWKHPGKHWKTYPVLYKPVVNPTGESSDNCARRASAHLRMRECVHFCGVVWDSKIIPKEPLEKHKECLDAFAYNEVRMGLGGLMTISTEGTRGQVPAQSGCGSKFLITIKKTLWHTTNTFFSPAFHFSHSFITLKWNSL